MCQESDSPAIGPQVIFGFDATGICTVSLGPGLERLGLRPGELVGRNLYDVYRRDSSSVHALDRVLAGETFSVERDFDDRRLWIYFEPVRDADGTVTGAVGVSTDVTEQRRLEAEARASRRRTALLADLATSLDPKVRDLEGLLRLAVRTATEAVADVGSIWLGTAGEDRLELRAVWSDEEDLQPTLDALTAGTAPGEVPSFEVDPETLTTPRLLDLTRTEDLDVPDADLLRRGAERFGLTLVLRVPLRARGVLLGVVDVARGRSRGRFQEADVHLVSDIAERCALALDNALLLSAQRDAREELVKFQALADASDNFVAIADDDGHPTYTNPRLRESGIEIDKGDVWRAVTTHAGSPIALGIRRALGSNGRWSGDADVTIAGRHGVMHGEVFRLAHPDTGAVLGTAWIGQDVTGLRAAEAALRAANAEMKQFKALVEASPDFIAIAGLDGRVMYVNPRGRDMIGMSPDVDVTTTSIADYLTPEGLEASLTVEQPAVLAYGHWEGESTLRNFRGPAIPVAIASFLMRDAETGEPFALATVQRDITERLRAEAALRELAEQRAALLNRLVDAQDAERTRIAADVHDDPVQALAVVDLRLGSMRRRLGERAPELLDILEPLQTSVAGATERLRALLFDLEPPDLAHGLTPALERAAGEIFANTPTRWTVNGLKEPDVPDATRAVAYRIAKEAMTNVRKHARADHVTVAVAGADSGLTLRVEDDGVGLGPGPAASSPGHRGLLGMQDRATVAGGRCTVENRAGGGTVVTAWLPGAASG